MKTKIMLITTLTLTVLIGGGLLYSNMIHQSNIANSNVENVYTFPQPLSYNNLDISKKLPKYIPSNRTRNTRLNSTNISGKKSVNPLYVNINSFSESHNSLNITLFKNNIYKNQKEGIYGNEVAVLPRNYSSARRAKSIINQSSTTISISGTNTTPMMNGNDAIDNGLTGNPDDPSDDFLPPEGAPIGNALLFMLFINLIYGILRFVREKKE